MWKKTIVRGEISLFIGDSHRYTTDKGTISLVYPSKYTCGMFEIYSIDGDLFDDIERYPTIKDAEDRIGELLGKKFKFGK